MQRVSRRIFLGLLAAPLLLRVKLEAKDVGPLPIGNWGLDELQWCADVIDMKAGDQVVSLRCNYAMRRQLIKVCGYDWRTNSLAYTYIRSRHNKNGFDMWLGDVKVEVSPNDYNNIVYMYGASGKRYTCNLRVPSVQYGRGRNGYYPLFYHYRGEDAWKTHP